MNTSTGNQVTPLQRQLCAMLTSVSQGKVQVDETDTDTSLRDLGLDSVVLLSFLVAIEDTFGVEWPSNVHKEVFGSIETISVYVQSMLDPAE